MGAAILLGTPVRADHRNDCGAKSEGQRNQDVFETSSHRVADGDLPPQAPGDARQEHDRKVGYDDVDQARDADLQDLCEQGWSQDYAAKPQRHERPGGAQIEQEHKTARTEGARQSPARACRSEAGSGPHPKIRTGEMRTCAHTLPTITPAGNAMLPVPRTALPSRLSMQMDTAPLNATLE